MQDLKGYQRQYLLRNAHKLSPNVIIGKLGLTDSLTKAVDNDLEHHELVKVKFNTLKKERRDITAVLAESVSAVVVRVLGNIAVLYREQDDPEKRRYRIPVRRH